ncbi:YcaO-like family protein [Nonomuraea sp. NPDC052116]|uniref:YcaO-like family protein n=1 Tax=Nonomuraea sp. NPDC052116 TaxID=3155665 RepID=UPI003431B1D9
MGRTRGYRASEVTAVLEALERWGGVEPGGKRTRVRASYAEAAADALDPRTLGEHDTSSYEREGFAFRPFTEDAVWDWVWGYSFGRRAPILVPESLAYYYVRGRERPFLFEISNGCALGGSMAEALLYGLLETVERDAFLMTWYGRLAAGAELRVVPTVAEAGITVRAATEEAATRAVARVAPGGGDGGSRRHRGLQGPPGANDPAATALVRRAHEAALGTVVTAPGGSACEDFPLYGVPSVYWYVGAAPPSGLVGRPHTGTFRPDPVPTLRAGVTAMQTATLAVLANPSQSTPPSRYHGPGAVAEH